MGRGGRRGGFYACKDMADGGLEWELRGGGGRERVTAGVHLRHLGVGFLGVYRSGCRRVEMGRRHATGDGTLFRMTAEEA